MASPGDACKLSPQR